MCGYHQRKNPTGNLVGFKASCPPATCAVAHNHNFVKPQKHPVRQLLVSLQTATIFEQNACLLTVIKLLCANWVAERCFSTVLRPSMPSLTNAATVYTVGTLWKGKTPNDTCRFVELVEELAHQGMVEQLGIVPVMCASATTPYALALVARLQAAVPNCIIHTQFLGPEELAQVRQGPCMSDMSTCCISAAEG